MWWSCAWDSCGFNTASVSCGSCSPDSLDVLYSPHFLKVISCHVTDREGVKLNARFLSSLSRDHENKI